MPENGRLNYQARLIFGKYHYLIIRSDSEPSEKAVLFFFGGGMILGCDKGDVKVAGRLAEESGCDVWFAFYPICTENCIAETYRMGYECYRQMIEVYGAGNVSTAVFSSGGALAIGIALYNNTKEPKLPMPRHIIAVSPGEVPVNEEAERMRSHNAEDPMVDFAFMQRVRNFMIHGNNNIPEFMVSGSLGDYSGIPEITFFYSSDEVVYGAKENFAAAREKYNVSYKVYERPGMIHCYPFLPYFPEAKEDFNKIADILSK